ncbi:Basic leucine zipper 43 [Nymphaea thermarum]|nr:Basic leucine zipper 43 [Nymphaea thermarum]
MFLPDDFAGKLPAVSQDQQQPARATVRKGRPGRVGVGSGQPVSEIDERKRRRMISNRESARRSRMRKQRHLDELRCLVNRLRLEKRQMVNRLGVLTYLHHQILLDSCRLRSEHADLSQKLAELRRILALRDLSEFSCNSSCHFSEGMLNQIPSSLIT